MALTKVQWWGVGRRLVGMRPQLRRSGWTLVAADSDVWRPGEYPKSAEDSLSCRWLYWDTRYGHAAYEVRPLNPFTVLWLLWALGWRRYQWHVLYPIARYLKRSGVCWWEPGAMVRWWQFIDSFTLNPRIMAERRQRR